MFLHAKPIWLDGLTATMNIQGAFHAAFSLEGSASDTTDATVRISAASLYRLTVNGRFAAYGPARAPHGFARVDVIDIAPLLRRGLNEVCVEVAGYHCYSFYTLKQLSFVCAEVQVDDSVVAATGRDFTGARVLAREQKVFRYSFQRAFSEVWDLGRPDLSVPVQEIALGLQWLARGVAAPDHAIRSADALLARGTVETDPDLPLRKNERYILGISETCSGFAEDEIPYRPYYDYQKLRYHPTPSRVTPGTQRLTAGEYALLDFGMNRTGFLRALLEVRRDSHVMVAFDEKLFDGIVDPRWIEMVNLVDYRLPERPAPYDLESFEAYEFRYLMVIVLEGEVAFDPEGIEVRSYVYPVAPAAHVSDDPQLAAIYAAAVETYRQNTLDVYMDCPSRERGGWLCDSYYTAQAEASFTGASIVERAFMKNFALYDGGTNVPKGIFPMCYPGDHPDGKFVPQWCMWFVLELEQFLGRCPDVDPEEYRRLCFGLVRFLEGYANQEGLLERLPSWNFVEWSRANDWVRDVNYPTNMLYAKVLEIIGTIYVDDALLDRCRALRAVVLRRSFNGTFFEDHAVRDASHVLVNCGDISEACQYYACRFGLIDLEDPRYSALKDSVLNVFGPGRDETGALPHIEPANALMGVYMRMELLLDMGRYDQLLSEIRAFFGHMAAANGTLWEHRDPSASMNHGFASFAGVALCKALERAKRQGKGTP
jgi:alpha-L-rhamnosidase